MVRDYERLCRNVSRAECFRGLEDVLRKVSILVSDLDLGTQYNYLVTFKKYVEFAKGKGVEAPLRFNLVLVKDFLSSYKDTTRQGYAFRLRKIFQWNGELADFKVKSADNDLPEVLSNREVNKIVKAASSLKWRAIFRLTYEGALRAHEVLGLRIKHVRFDKFGAEVYVPSTKSDSLWLRVIDSAPLLQQWFEQHQDQDNREAWLFPGRKGRVTYIGFYLALRWHATKAHIKKKVSPHILRHSRLAWLKKFGVKIGISDSVICKLYGRWSRKNAHRMLDRYGKIEPVEANELVLQAYGKLNREKLREPLVKPQECPRCRAESDALSKYCRRCGMVLDEKEALRLSDRDRDLRRIGKLLENPFVVEALEEKARELSRKRKRLE